MNDYDEAFREAQRAYEQVMRLRQTLQALPEKSLHVQCEVMCDLARHMLHDLDTLREEHHSILELQRGLLTTVDDLGKSIEQGCDAQALLAHMKELLRLNSIAKRLDDHLKTFWLPIEQGPYFHTRYTVDVLSQEPLCESLARSVIEESFSRPVAVSIENTHNARISAQAVMSFVDDLADLSVLGLDIDGTPLENE